MDAHDFIRERKDCSTDEYSSDDESSSGSDSPVEESEPELTDEQKSTLVLENFIKTFVKILPSADEKETGFREESKERERIKVDASEKKSSASEPAAVIESDLAKDDGGEAYSPTPLSEIKPEAKTQVSLISSVGEESKFEREKIEFHASDEKASASESVAVIGKGLSKYGEREIESEIKPEAKTKVSLTSSIGEESKFERGQIDFDAKDEKASASESVVVIENDLLEDGEGNIVMEAVQCSQASRMELIVERVMCEQASCDMAESNLKVKKVKKNKYGFGFWKKKSAVKESKKLKKPEYVASKAANQLGEFTEASIKEKNVEYYEAEVNDLYENNAHVSYVTLKSFLKDLFCNEERHSCYCILLHLLRSLGPVLGTCFIWPCKSYLTEEFKEENARMFEQAKGSAP